MTYRMSEFQGIEPGHVEKLRAAGIENTDDMMRLWGDKTTRPTLVEKTGIDAERLSRIVSMARLARVTNIGPKFVAVLLAADIDGPKSLFEHKPEALVKRLAEVAAEKKLTTPVPTLEDVKPWYAEREQAVTASK